VFGYMTYVLLLEAIVAGQKRTFSEEDPNAFFSDPRQAMQMQSKHAHICLTVRVVYFCSCVYCLF
jgi:hypothetical protein